MRKTDRPRLSVVAVVGSLTVSIPIIKHRFIFVPGPCLDSLLLSCCVLYCPALILSQSRCYIPVRGYLLPF